MGGNDETMLVPGPRQRAARETFRAGEYDLGEVLGQGGCAVVYRAKHRVLGRQVAVKILDADLARSPEMVERFVREVRAVGIIGHPNIVNIYEFGSLPDGRPYFAMELLEGPNLHQMMDQVGVFAAHRCLEILEPVCQALQAAHCRGIVHRDLKPSNILVSFDRTPPMVKLVDFGIAKLLHPGEMNLTAAGRRIGTPTSMAPEQVRGAPDVGPATDIYALGILLYQMLTGRVPFSHPDPREIERMHLSMAPRPPSTLSPVSPEVDAVVLRCLEKEPGRRYESADAFVQALRQAITERIVDEPTTASLSAVAALFVEARVRGDGDEEDDDVLDDLDEVFAIAEQCLTQAEAKTVFRSGSALLGALVDAAPDADLREPAIEVALELHRALEGRPGRHPRIHVNISVHAGKTLVTRSASGVELGDCEICAVSRWAPTGDLDGVCVTTSALPPQYEAGSNALLTVLD